jgi:hypothetical protein
MEESWPGVADTSGGLYTLHHPEQNAFGGANKTFFLAVKGPDSSDSERTGQ